MMILTWEHYREQDGKLNKYFICNTEGTSQIRNRNEVSLNVIYYRSIIYTNNNIDTGNMIPTSCKTKYAQAHDLTQTITYQALTILIP